MGKPCGTPHNLDSVLDDTTDCIMDTVITIVTVDDISDETTHLPGGDEEAEDAVAPTSNKKDPKKPVKPRDK